VREAQRHVADFGERALEVRYEDLLLEPVDELRRITDFLGCSVSAGQLDSLCGGVRPERAYAYRSNPELRAVAKEFHVILAAGGYPGDDA
jgi:hypothetical protein